MADEIKNYINTVWGNIFDKFNSSDDAGEIQILQKIPIFADLSRKELRYLTGILYERVYEAGEYIFENDQPGAAMFIIKSGEIHIRRYDSNSNEIHLATLRDGEFVGELALLDNSPRSASAYVCKKTKALAIFRSDLEKLLETKTELGSRVMRRLAIIIGMRLKATNELLIKMEEEQRERAQ